MLLYPKEVPTSALIELEYAISRKKHILILTSDFNILPYLAKGLNDVYTNTRVAVSDFSVDNLVYHINDFLETKIQK